MSITTRMIFNVLRLGAPPGCSVNSGGDWAPIFNLGQGGDDWEPQVVETRGEWPQVPPKSWHHLVTWEFLDFFGTIFWVKRSLFSSFRSQFSFGRCDSPSAFWVAGA